MDDKFGPIAYPRSDQTEFYKPYSEATAEMIDTRVRELVKEALDRTVRMLTEKRDSVVKLAERLLEREVLSQVHPLSASCLDLLFGSLQQFCCAFLVILRIIAFFLRRRMLRS